MKTDYRGVNFGNFMTCAYSIHFLNVLCLILGFTFGVWPYILIFTKLMLLEKKKLIFHF